MSFSSGMLGLCGVLVGSCVAAAAEGPTIEYTLDVAPVWAGHPVGFSLLTSGERQFVAFYDDQRRMTVAARTLDSTEWHFERLPSNVEWDSHNYIAMAADAHGYLHLSGNMHCVPLIYFRTREPWDISTFERIPAMVGSEEARCTYPVFFTGPAGELIFTYRDGRSGDGTQIFNTYDTEARAWRRLLDRPLLSGGGDMNAYPIGPTLGPDGVYHLIWVWRDTPDCATNHDLSYARSRDLVRWEKSDGTPLELPMTLTNSEIVDPVPAGGGIINGNTRLGFDTRQRVILSYHKYDENGHTQIYNARREEDGWKIYQATEWEYRWEFSGGGTIPFEVGVGGVSVTPEGALQQHFRNPKDGGATWRLDEATLKPVERVAVPSTIPRALARPESDFPGIQVRWREDAGASPDPGASYRLRWETLGQNRDRPRQGDLPPPSMLRLYKIRAH